MEILEEGVIGWNARKKRECGGEVFEGGDKKFDGSDDENAMGMRFRGFRTLKLKTSGGQCGDFNFLGGFK